jgi:hypothetical protein
MVDVSLVTPLSDPSFIPSFIKFMVGVGVVLIALVILDKIHTIIIHRRPPPVVGHLTQEQWLAHRDSFHGYDGMTVVQWLYVHGLPPLNKEDYSPERWRKLTTLPIGTATVPDEYLPAQHGLEV